MKLNQKLLTRIGVIALSVSCMSMTAQAATEIEPNAPVSSAQMLASESSDLNVSGSLTFAGFDPRTRQPNRDVDFYSFYAFAGDRIDVGVSGVSSSVALFGEAPGFSLLATGDSSARITGHTVAKNGTYTIAVANRSAFFSNGGTVSGGAFEQGSYTLSVTGLSLPSFEISIDVQPRKHKTTRIKLWKKKRVKVAILGSPDFSVADVDTSSLTFGATGDEPTLRKCKRRFKDVNRDGEPDLVCKFSLNGSSFTEESQEVVLKGYTNDGVAFYGTDKVKVRQRDKVSHRSRKHRD